MRLLRGVDLGRVPAHGQPTAVHAAGCPSATDRAHPLGTMQALGVLARPGTTATACTVCDAAEAQMPVPLRACPPELHARRDPDHFRTSALQRAVRTIVFTGQHGCNWRTASRPRTSWSATPRRSSALLSPLLIVSE
ncbi:DUF6233 domain-containing protein [Streptomyces yangpuensis]|uniref:DUF6233 domain-containing protein n=1 Tax=Streptomyces yangpuensis TaxID=1648182 RepID=UPI00364AA48C